MWECCKRWEDVQSTVYQYKIYLIHITKTDTQRVTTNLGSYNQSLRCFKFLHLICTWIVESPLLPVAARTSGHTKALSLQNLSKWSGVVIWETYVHLKRMYQHPHSRYMIRPSYNAKYRLPLSEHVNLLLLSTKCPGIPPCSDLLLQFSLHIVIKKKMN